MRPSTVCRPAPEGELHDRPPRTSGEALALISTQLQAIDSLPNVCKEATREAVSDTEVDGRKDDEKTDNDHRRMPGNPPSLHITPDRDTGIGITEGLPAVSDSPSIADVNAGHMHTLSGGGHLDRTRCDASELEPARRGEDNPFLNDTGLLGLRCAASQPSGGKATGERVGTTSPELEPLPIKLGGTNETMVFGAPESGSSNENTDRNSICHDKAANSDHTRESDDNFDPSLKETILATENMASWGSFIQAPQPDLLEDEEGSTMGVGSVAATLEEPAVEGGYYPHVVREECFATGEP